MLNLQSRRAWGLYGKNQAKFQDVYRTPGNLLFKRPKDNLILSGASHIL